MKSSLSAGLLVLALAVPAEAQFGLRRFPPPPPAADLSGTWFFNGDRNKPARIVQYPPGRRAEFTNENGDSAWGTIRGDRVWIPDWTDRGTFGLEGRIRGDRIVWPDGTFWSRGVNRPGPGVPDISGTWYFRGDRRKPARIVQYPPGRRAEFTNENGDSAWGTVRGDRVWIPDWTDRGTFGLEGRIRGDRIVWPDGAFWSR
jgi:hypothetical protein